MVITPQMYEKNTYVFYPLRMIYTYLICSAANVNDGISMKIYLSSIENYIYVPVCIPSKRMYIQIK